MDLRVTVRYFTTLRELAGNTEEKMEMEGGATLAGLIAKVASKYGEEARNYLYHEETRIDPSIYFMVNGVNAKLLSGLDTKLRDGDVVAIIPPIGGG
jgi:MoaD family protein